MLEIDGWAWQPKSEAYLYRGEDPCLLNKGICLVKEMYPTTEKQQRWLLIMKNSILVRFDSLEDARDKLTR